MKINRQSVTCYVHVPNKDTQKNIQIFSHTFLFFNSKLFSLKIPDKVTLENIFTTPESSSLFLEFFIKENSTK